MSYTKNLETIYIPLKLGDWVAPDLKDPGYVSNGKSITLQEALNWFERITIVGAPGSGKTTISSHTAAAIADNSVLINDKKFFPVYIQLRRLKEFLESEKEKNTSLKELMIESLEKFGFKSARKFIERKLDDGLCVLVLDGFDELADREGVLQQRFATKVNNFVTSIPSQNRIVITARAAGYEPAWFTGFRVFEMTELTLPQANEFISGWFGKAQDDYSKSLQRILEKNERLQMLVTSPLMLAIVCFVYGSKRLKDSFLPNRRTDLYEQCIEALTSEWDKSRGINREPRFTSKQIEKVLRHVAYEALVTEKIDFTTKDLLALIRTHMPKADLRQYDDELFLNEVLQHTGLFKEKAHKTVGFIHLTFQEYLAAHVIADMALTGIQRKDIRSECVYILQNIANPRWFEPIALSAGILRGRPELVMMLHEEYQERPTKEVKLLLAGCLRDADLTDPSFGSDYLLKQDEILSDLVELASNGGHPDDE